MLRGAADAGRAARSAPSGCISFGAAEERRRDARPADGARARAPARRAGPVSASSATSSCSAGATRRTAPAAPVAVASPAESDGLAGRVERLEAELAALREERARAARGARRVSARTPGSSRAARGSPTQVEARWRDDAYEPPGGGRTARPTMAVDALRERGSPCHDGLSTRLVSYGEDGRRAGAGAPAVALGAAAGGGRRLDQPHGALRGAHRDGRWLAGRRAAWVSTWASRWALGAGGAVDLGESPAETLPRELHEEWQLEPRAAHRRGARGAAQRHGDGGRAGDRGRLLRAGARRRARRVGVVGPRTWTAGPATRTTACG